MKVKVSNAWKDGIPWVKVSGAWKKAVAEWVKVGGVWKKVAYAFNNIIIYTPLQYSQSGGGFAKSESVFQQGYQNFLKSDPEYPVSRVYVYARKQGSSYKNAYIKLRFTDVDESSRLINALESNTAQVHLIGAGSQGYSKANANIIWDARLKELTIEPNSLTTPWNILYGQYRKNDSAKVKIVYRD